MWFLGAGASASSGVPTALHMTWDFKQRLYVSQKRVSPTIVADLSNPSVRNRLQQHVDSLKSLPARDDPDEYAALFEFVYPSEADRRAYLDGKLAGGKPSYGHLALATLMRAGSARIVWTTNFDPLVADAVAHVFGGTGHLTSIDLNRADAAEATIADERWPIEFKLHGDFRFRRLKNTIDELREQDQSLRQSLIASCRRYGLVVVGYSGRDASVMNALEAALEDGLAFPKGLFWLHRGANEPLECVGKLLLRASKAGVDAALVRIDNFDEILRDVIRLVDGLDTTALDSFAAKRSVWSPAPAHQGRGTWPVVRLNALPVVQAPTQCRRVVCNLGGYSEVRAAVATAGVDVLIARVNAGVLAFGSDADVRAAFERHAITDFDLHTIELRRLSFDSGERGLLRQALTRALAEEFGLDIARKGSTDLLAPSDPNHRQWAQLKQLVPPLSGKLARHPELSWREGIGVRLDWANDQLWLLFDPMTVFDGVTNENRAAAADFARERTVKRYNRMLNDLLAFWSNLLGGDRELRAFGLSNGVDAVFRISNVCGFSRRTSS